MAHKIVVFSDIHINAKTPDAVPDHAARLSAGLAHAAASVPDADLYLLCGDLTHFGDAESYRQLHPLLDNMPAPVVPMLGNHDNRAAFRAVFDDVQTDENGFIQRVINLGEWRLIILDTLIVQHEGDAFSHAGELCAKRMAWLDTRLSEAGDTPCMIAMHHPPHDTGFAAMDGIKLRNGEDFYDLLHRHGNVRHIIAGHIHRTISGTYRGIPFSIFKSPGVQMPLMWNGTDTSVDCDEPPAFGIVLIEGDTILVHTEDFAER